ncbi:MAG: hypothetical protein F6K39_05545 [Okeania sp. SIO3B3]|nr:hypothetical protein [Okeania sp. SIO3B3]
MNKQIIQSTIATITLVTGISIATPARAFFRDPLLENTNNAILPESLSDSVLQKTSELSGLAIEELEIVDYQQKYWNNGCLGLVFPGPRYCTQAFVFGWIVNVESETQKWTYHNRRLASHYQSEFDAEQKKWSNRVTNYTRYTPLNFFDFPETQEYDPTQIEGFRYKITSDSWSGRLTLPTSTTEENLFTILTENSTTQVSSGTDLNLNSGNGEGAKEFTITNINPSINWLEYPALISPDFSSSPTFTYEVELLEKPEESPIKPIPEPNTTFSLLALGIWGLLKGKKIEHN